MDIRSLDSLSIYSVAWHKCAGAYPARAINCQLGFISLVCGRATQDHTPVAIQ